MASMEPLPPSPDSEPAPVETPGEVRRLQEQLEEADPAEAPEVAEELAARLADRLEGDEGTP